MAMKAECGTAHVVLMIRKSRKLSLGAETGGNRGRSGEGFRFSKEKKALVVLGKTTELILKGG